MATPADEAKAKGNTAFSSRDYTTAIKHFTEAINHSPTNHVLYSNRSASYASLNQYTEALSDATKTVQLKPDWAKGYSRLGAAHLGLHNYSEAVEAYTKGLEVDPTNDALKSGLADARAALNRRAGPSGSGPSPFGNIFGGQDLFVKLAANPKTRGYLDQPDFKRMIGEVQKNPNMMNHYMHDSRMMEALGVLLNIELKTATPEEMARDVKMDAAKEEEEVVKVVEKEKVVEVEPMEVVEEKGGKVEALKEKELGNVAYKKKDFEKAIEHYSKAMELYDEDISFVTNRAAVYLEMGKYEDCIKDCETAVERGRELRTDYKMIAKALTRKATALVKMAKCSKDFDSAIDTFQKALTEHRNPDTLKRLNEAERKKKELLEQEYFNPEIADEEREKGNEYFKKQMYPEAVKHYTEALKRNPKDPKVYSNRAACYTKLTALPEGLKDAEKCIELDPTFSKGYTRKGAIQFFMKEYDKALETYQEGLKHDPNNQDLLEGVRSCVGQINRTNRGDLSPDELKERQARAMQDPEIQNILTDPVMRQVLQDLQESPGSAQDHLKNPQVMNKIQKLVSAGIVQLK